MLEIELASLGSLILKVQGMALTVLLNFRLDSSFIVSIHIASLFIAIIVANKLN